MTYTHRFVIPDGSASVLLIRDGQGWALPSVDSHEPEIVIDAAPSLRDVVGDDVFVLRDVRSGPMSEADPVIVYVTEPVPDPSIARGRWSSQDVLSEIAIEEPRDREALGTWFAGDDRASLQPWQRPGWFRTVEEWIEQTLPGVSEVEQFATWCNSCILRVTFTAGRSWFKASPRYFIREPAVTATLAELLPGRTPRVLGLDTERGWMLLEDLGDLSVDLLPVDERLDGLIAVGELHRASVDRTDALLAGGCLDRRPQVLSTQIAALAADDTIPLPGDLGARFLARVPRLQGLCAELGSSPIAPTLVHGDLHAGNIMRTPDRLVVFDWSDACIADPFVDVSMFLARLPDEPDLRRIFRDRYLDTWADVASRADLIAWARLAEPLAAMHHAVTYRGVYDAFGEDEWWLFEGALPTWIERSLASPLLA